MPTSGVGSSTSRLKHSRNRLVNKSQLGDSSVDESPEIAKVQSDKDDDACTFKRRSFSFQVMPCYKKNSSQGNLSGDKRKSTTDSEEKEKIT